MNELENRGNLVPFWKKPVLKEGHPFTTRDICRDTGLTDSQIKHILSAKCNGSEPPLVRPEAVSLNHIKTNTYSPEDFKIFRRISELMNSGQGIGKAVKSLREESLMHKLVVDREDNSILEMI